MAAGGDVDSDGWAIRIAVETAARNGWPRLYHTEMSATDPLLAPMQADERHDIGGVQVDISQAGNARVKRMIYPPGFNWATHLSPVIGSKLCMHAHVGFMAKGQINVRFSNGSVVEYRAPQFVAVEPGHEGWVVGDEPAVLIEFDFEQRTVEQMDLPPAHSR